MRQHIVCIDNTVEKLEKFAVGKHHHNKQIHKTSDEYRTVTMPKVAS